MTTTKPTKPRTKKTATAVETTITAYKAFGADWKCLDFQYEVGKSYVHKGAVEACASGFHACENPMDTWSYYPVTDSKFAVVELSGEISRHGTDSKVAAGKITIKAEIGIPQIVADSVQYVLDLCKDAKGGENASGDGSKQAASGDGSTQAASGDGSTQAASGYGSTQAASGDGSTQAASGYGSTQAASGYGSKQAASGYGSTQAASGDGSTQAASGYGSKQAASGKKGVIMSAGSSGRAKAAEGGCFALRWDDSERPRIVIGYVGENGIKADTWYSVDASGSLVECSQ